MTDTKPYVIRQGDYLDKLAARFGFDTDQVWNHPSNDELRRRRPNPNILAPGDLLQVPRSSKEALAIQPGRPNRFKGRVATTMVQLVLRDSAGGCLGNEPFIVDGIAEPTKGSTTAQGELTVTVPVHTAEFRLFLPKRNQHYMVKVGHLDPVSEMSGVRARLEHLGFLDSGVDANGDDEGMNAAIRAFRAKHGLEAKEDLDDAMLGKLCEEHGC